mgnify:CR=1 FL=1
MSTAVNEDAAPAASRAVRLLVAYHGAAYHGWQAQASGIPTVQGVLRDALREVTGRDHPLPGASRTDAGVHAWGQVVSLVDDATLPLKAYVRGVNRYLPEDVRVRDAEEVAPDFHPRHASVGKRYRYRWQVGVGAWPLERDRAWHVTWRLDVAAMAAAAQLLVGTHDFSAFRGSGCDAASPVKSLWSLGFAEGDRGRIELEIQGSAFLKYMVRNIAGALVEVGRGKRDLAWLAAVLESRDRRHAGMCAPPQGLELVEVLYGEGGR